MDPRHDPDLILGHLEGDLSPEDAAKIQALIEADPDFAALLKGMANDRAQLRAAPAAQPPAGMADMALADLERSMLLDDATDSLALPTPGRRRFALAPLLTYGAIAAVLALTANAVLKSVQPPTPPTTIAAAPPEQPFDIAAATIQTQRELARRDRADVRFGGELAETDDLDSVDGDAPSPERMKALASGATTRKSSVERSTPDVQAVAELDRLQAPRPQASAAIASVDAAAPIDNAFAAVNNMAALRRRASGEQARPPVVAANQAATLDATKPDAAFLATAAVPATALTTDDPGPSPASDVASVGASVASDAERDEVAAIAPPEPSPAGPAWTHTLQSLGDDWTRWTTFSVETRGDAPRPPAKP